MAFNMEGINSKVYEVNYSSIGKTPIPVSALFKELAQHPPPKVLKSIPLDTNLYRVENQVLTSVRTPFITIACFIILWTCIRLIIRGLLTVASKDRLFH